MNFCHVRPRLHLKVTAKTESFSSGASWIKPRPFADLRILAVRSDEPIVGQSFLRSCHSRCIDFRDARTPAELYTLLGCVLHEKLMQFYSTYRQARRAREIRARRMFLVRKPDSFKRKTALLRQGDAERAQSRNTLGQDAFSAGLVDRRISGIENNGTQSLAACRDRSNDPRRSRSDHNDRTLPSHD